MNTTVLAYSGGLDTSVILHHLVKEGFTVHAVYVNLGQPGEDMEEIAQKAKNCGAASFHNIDRREELCADFAFPVLQFQAKYEGNYLLGTSIARPVIAKACVEVAKAVKADTYSHGATGKGNDQCRFQLAANALDPALRIYALWRDEAFRAKFPGRTEMIEYARKHGIPVKATKKKPYSSDENLLHISYEAGILEDLEVDGEATVDFGMTVAPEKAPAKGAKVAIAFENGIPVAVDGKALAAHEIVAELNRIGGAHGVGRIDMVEGRFVGMKSRGVYEAPGMTLLYTAHRALEQITMDRDLMHLRDRLAPEVAELVYYGFWYSRKMDSLLAFVREAERNVTGEVVLRLYKGNVNIVARRSKFSLYDLNIATMEGGGDFNQTDSEGFLRIQGLPIRVEARFAPWKKALKTTPRKK